MAKVEYEEVEYDPWGDPSVEELKTLYRQMQDNQQEWLRQAVLDRAALVDGLKSEFARLRDEIASALSQPRIVRLQRDANGRADSATSELAVTRH